MENKLLEDGELIKQFNPLSLAFIGDAIYESYVRERVLYLYPEYSVSKLHNACVNYVKASSQSYIIGALEEKLTSDEDRIYKRGRNTKSNTVAKNAKMSDYRRSTGFEALIGYLHLKKDYERLNEILQISVDIVEKEIVKSNEKKSL